MWFQSYKILEIKDLHDLIHQELLQKSFNGTPAERRTLVEHLLFGKYQISTELMETYYLPFGNSGYLNAQQKFNRMLYLAAKGNHGRGVTRLFELTGWLQQESAQITEKDVNQAYLEWCKLGICEFNESDKRKLFLDMMDPLFGHDVVERLINENQEQILAGECLMKLLPDGIKKKEYEAIGLVLNRRLIVLDFLRFSHEEHMISFIHSMIAKERQGELTAAMPRWKNSRIEAIRPPAGKWGFVMTSQKGED